MASQRTKENLFLIIIVICILLLTTTFFGAVRYYGHQQKEVENSYRIECKEQGTTDACIRYLKSTDGRFSPDYLSTTYDGREAILVTVNVPIVLPIPPGYEVILPGLPSLPLEGKVRVITTALFVKM